MSEADLDTAEGQPEAPVMQGVRVIEAALATLPLSPGVYRMLDAKGDALYVGKVRALKKRVVAYTQVGRLPERLRRMVHETRSLEVITTASEAEALLLEANLIKKLRPRYNIVLRDDKSYPWLVLTEDHPYPQITKHRGERRKGASYWGPFASAWAVNQTLTLSAPLAGLVVLISFLCLLFLLDLPGLHGLLGGFRRGALLGLLRLARLQHLLLRGGGC